MRDFRQFVSADLIRGSMKQDRFSPWYSPSLRAAGRTHDNHHNLKKQAMRLRSLVRLVYFAKHSAVNEGDYYFRFHFHITRP